MRSEVVFYSFDSVVLKSALETEAGRQRLAKTIGVAPEDSLHGYQLLEQGTASSDTALAAVKLVASQANDSLEIEQDKIDEVLEAIRMSTQSGAAEFWMDRASPTVVALLEDEKVTDWQESVSELRQDPGAAEDDNVEEFLEEHGARLLRFTKLAVKRGDAILIVAR